MRILSVYFCQGQQSKSLSAVYDDDAARRIGRPVRQKPGDGGADLLRAPEPLRRYAGQHPIDEHGAGLAVIFKTGIGEDDSGANAVYPDVRIHPLHRHGLAHIFDAGPGGAGVDHAGHAVSVSQRDVDDGADFGRVAHVLHERLATEEKRPGQVRVQDGAEAVPGHVVGRTHELAAGVVHQIVQAAERIDDVLYQRHDAPLGFQVHRPGTGDDPSEARVSYVGRAALRPQTRVYPFGRLDASVGVSAGDYYGRSENRQLFGDGESDARAASGHQSHSISKESGTKNAAPNWIFWSIVFGGGRRRRR
mmetsp:Transcript_17132/g.38599  ORF Transcript_17132/g.38599 Transcript_17132/m.38599 type:complete len:306 (+) Transcript_17132:256-1173(+)